MFGASLIATVIATVGSVAVGGVVAAITIVSLVNGQTAADKESPANVNQPVVTAYGQ